MRITVDEQTDAIVELITKLVKERKVEQLDNLLVSLHLDILRPVDIVAIIAFSYPLKDHLLFWTDFYKRAKQEINNRGLADE